MTETADNRYRGTALTLQTALGFMLTLITIRGVPTIADAIGWQWAFPWLAIGPVIGILAMKRLAVYQKHQAQERELAGSS